MNEHEVEHETAGANVPREVQAAVDAHRGGGASLDAGVREALAPGLGDPLADVRIHTDTSAGTLARAVSARAFATGSELFFAPGEYRPGTTDGDRLLAHELAHVVQQRGAPTSGVMRLSEPGDAHEREAETMAAAALTPGATPAVARVTGEVLVARDFIDDVASIFSGSETRAEKTQPKEVPVTQQDVNQINSLVSVPLAVAKRELAGEADLSKAKSAADKLIPAGQALSVIASTKTEPKNRDNLYAPLNSISAAVTTLQVMTEPAKARDVWKGHFDAAMNVVDRVLALPIRDEAQDQDPARPAGNPSETLTQRDHDLIVSGLKPQLERLIATTSGEPYSDWDPKVVAADNTVTAAASAFSNRKLNTMRLRVELGLQAIKTFAMSINEQLAEALAQIQSAEARLAQATQSAGADPNSQPPAQP